MFRRFDQNVMAAAKKMKANSEQADKKNDRTGALNGS
jgi:hypothetical protein